jgi:hypothetical protein
MKIHKEDKTKSLTENLDIDNVNDNGNNNKRFEQED